MFKSKKLMILFGLLIVASMVLSACQPAATAEPEVQVETVVETVVVTKEVEGKTVEVVITATAEPEAPPEPEGPRTLVICQGQEPETLYIYGGNMLAMSAVQEAVYDGPFDARSFDYQAVIMEKLPSLADGDAIIQSVTVTAGDTVMTDDGSPATLEEGMMIRESECSAADCAVPYEGGDVEMDQMVVTFKLYPGLMWSDGTPLTAADSVYSFNVSSDPDTPSTKYTLDRTAAYEALDDVTIQWTGLPGYKDSQYFTNIWSPLPQHQLDQYTPAELIEAEETARAPLGWGPYVIEEWTVGDNIRMTKNDNYFRADEGLPKFDFVVYRMVGENSNANIAKILSGECDIVDQTSHLDDQSELLLELQAAGQVNATFVTGTVWEHADLGITPVTYDDGWQDGDRPDFFGDVRVRRAIAHCFDRQAVVDTVMFGQSVVLDTYLPPQHPLFNANVTSYAYDVEAGSALLEEAGWVLGEDGVRVFEGDNERIPAGTRLSFNYWTTSATQRQQATQLLAQTAAECGIEIALEYWSPGEYFADGPDGPVFGRRFDIGQFAWLTGVEPPCDLYLTASIPGEDLEVFPAGWGGSNDAGYSSPEFDAACNAALQSLPGEASYDENHLLAQEIFATDLPVVPLYLRLKLAATRPDMCGFVMDPTANSEMWNIESFDYGDCSE